MRDYFSENFEWDEDGKLRKRKRVLPDGASMHVPMGFYDGRFVNHFSDGSLDHTSPHRPGHRFVDVDDEAKLRAEEAYRERSQRMATAWRDKGDHQQQAAARQKRVTSATLDEARALADAAYEQRRAGLHYTTNRHRRQNDLATECPSPRKMDAGQLADAAQRAYDERSKRMANRWRDRVCE